MVAAKLFDPAAGRQRVDRYELIGEIASGGMATVFLARLTGVGGFQRFVAMKRLHPHLAGDQEFVEMFLDEARLAAGIHHPNVVSILEVGASPVGYYLVMEYIEGDTLARLLARAAGRSQRIPPHVTLRIALDMLAGLHAAHELRDDTGQPINLVHRDVSPQNVLVGGDGIARITDFGVARAASRLSATRVGQLKGKIAYMAPEQAQGDDQIDRRADVFSAGILVWEALAAKRLFKADNEAATLSRVMSEPVPDLFRIVPHVPREVCDVVMRALERDREARFASCAEFADALEASAQDRLKIASARELSAYVDEVMGEEIARQRDGVRGWLSRTDPSQADAVPFPIIGVVPSSSVSAAAMSLPDGSLSVSHRTLADAPRRSPALRIGLLLLLLLAVGSGGFYASRLVRSNETAAAPGSVTPARPAVQAANSTAAPTPAAAGSSAPALSAAVTSTPPAEGATSATGSAASVPRTPPAVALRPAPRAARPPSVPVARPRQKKAEDAIPVNPYR